MCFTNPKSSPNIISSDAKTNGVETSASSALASGLASALASGLASALASGLASALASGVLCTLETETASGSGLATGVTGLLRIIISRI